jgi:hypothetical protein
MGFEQFRPERDLYQQPTGSYADGVWTTSGSETNVKVNASFQPANDKVRKNPPEGWDVDSLFEIGTDTQLYVAERGGNRQSDQIDIDGQRYEVIRLERWQNTIISHYWYLIGLIDNE